MRQRNICSGRNTQGRETKYSCNSRVNQGTLLSSPRLDDRDHKRRNQIPILSDAKSVRYTSFQSPSPAPISKQRPPPSPSVHSSPLHLYLLDLTSYRNSLPFLLEHKRLPPRLRHGNIPLGN